MASDTKDAWDDVGKHFADLGKRLGEHYRRLASGDTEQEAVDLKKVGDTLRSLTEQLDRAFTSLGNTLRDPEAKESATRAARSLGDALSATFEEVGDQVRR